MRSSADTQERRLVLTIGAIVFVDTMFYAVIAPLLPTLVHELHLSKLSAGLMTASYPLGTLLGALPGGMLAARAGPRTAVVTGLTLLAVSTVAFALLHDAVALDLARLVQGIGGACSWAGGIAWVAAESAPERRGASIGRVLAAAIGGALLGPVIGTLASATGRAAAFSAVVLLAAVLIAAARALPSAHVSSEQGLGDVRSALAGRGIATGMWLVALPAVAAGVLSVLGPLRLHDLGGGAAAIGATFLVAAAVEAMVSSVIGGVSDRRGRLVPLRIGLALSAGLLVCFTIPESVLGLGVLLVAIDASLGTFWAPAMALLSDAADAERLDQGLAAALMNLAWAGGQMLGAGAGGAIAGALGDIVPVSIAAALSLLTLSRLGRVTAVEATPRGAPVSGA